ncbi:O-antigen polymerase [Rossellomorea marisflavi]|uniref:O-antigen polymerase n=1 Tax=Rossellomorea marisflavi TaxID=189381 RepID=UPI003FA05BAC
MVYILILFLIIIFFISFTVTGQDLLSPWVISCLMFILSALFIVPNIESWNVNLRFFTIITILVGLCSFGFGEMIVRKLTYQKAQAQAINQKTTSKEQIHIHYSILLFFIIFMAIVTYFYYNQVLHLAYAAGYTPSSELPMLRFARIATTSNIMDTVRTNKLLGQCVILSYSYAYLMVYILVHNLIFGKFKKYYILYILPIMIFLVQVILTGGRTQFIYLVGSCLLTFFIMYQIKIGWKFTQNIRYVKNAIVVFIVMLLVFYVLGTFTGKTSKLNLIETMSIYTGSSIVAFDIFLHSNMNSPTNIMYSAKLFGSNTLFGIYDVLRIIGFRVPNLVNQAEFVSLGAYETNIYTSYMRYIKDFSYLGFILIEIFLGFLFSFMYQKIKIVNRSSILIVIYSIMFQVIIETSIEERFFMNVLSLGYVSRVGYLILLYLLLVKIRVRR